MIKFKEFLRECLLNERNDFDKEYRQSNDYRHSIGLPDEDKIPVSSEKIPNKKNITKYFITINYINS